MAEGGEEVSSLIRLRRGFHDSIDHFSRRSYRGLRIELAVRVRAEGYDAKAADDLPLLCLHRHSIVPRTLVWITRPLALPRSEKTVALRNLVG